MDYIQRGSFVEVTSEFEATVDGDLSVFQGDIVKVDTVINADWLEGTFVDQSGIFPKSHCQLIQLVTTNEPYGVAIYSHEAHQEDELGFSAGEQITLVSRVNSEWFNGSCGGALGIFPASFIYIVNDFEESLAKKDSPARPKSLDRATLASLRSSSGTRSPARPTSHPSPSPPGPPKTAPPPRPGSPDAPPRPGSPDVACISPPLFRGIRSPERASPRVPQRPPPLEAAMVATLKKRDSSVKAPLRPVSLFNEDAPPASVIHQDLPPVDISKMPKNLPSPSTPPTPRYERISNPTSPIYETFSPQYEQLPDSIPSDTEEEKMQLGFTPVRHQGYSDWNQAESPQHVYEERKTYGEYGAEQLEECVVESGRGGREEGEVEELYANAADIATVEKEYKTSAIEEAALKKMYKSIEEKEKQLAIEQASKIKTEDLLGQQFTGKKVAKENVELLRSLLNAHNEKISDLCNRIDSMKAKARALKSPNNDRSEKLEGIERRDKVLIELVETEASNLKQLQLCVKGFIETLKQETDHTIDVDLLFLNMEGIVLVCEKLHMMLSGQTTLMSHEQMIGRCFTHLEADLHREYTFFLENHTAVAELTKQYQDDKTNKEMLDKCFEKIREETVCWNLQSFLIRPVQRIMKYPLLLRDMAHNTPAHWADRPYLNQAIRIVDNIVIYANENKRKDELLTKYNSAGSSIIPKLTLHSIKKKSKRFTTSITHSLNITSHAVQDSTFSDLSERFFSMVLIVKTLIREATNFTDLLKKVQSEMDNLCASIHNFYDHLESQKNVFLYHAAALRIAQNITPRFIQDLEGGPLLTLNELLSFFTAPQYLIEKRDSKRLDYDNLSAQQSADGGIGNEHLKIARGEFEALNKQLLDDLPILIHEGAEVVKKCSYSVLALFCQYSHSCHDEFRKALDNMSLELDEAPECMFSYHQERMKTCCATLLTICSFDKEVTQAIVLGGHVKGGSRFYEGTTAADDPITASYDISAWLESQPSELVQLSSDEDLTVEPENTPDTSLDEVFEKPGNIEDAGTGTNCRVLYDFPASNETMLAVGEGECVTLVQDCAISDTWAYVKSGERKGYVPKTYLTLPKTLKNKPAPLPPQQRSQSLSATPVDRTKSHPVKRKAPPPPIRSISEVTQPLHPFSLEPELMTLAELRQDTQYSSSDQSTSSREYAPLKSRTLPRRAAPVPPGASKPPPPGLAPAAPIAAPTPPSAAPTPPGAAPTPAGANKPPPADIRPLPPIPNIPPAKVKQEHAPAVVENTYSQVAEDPYAGRDLLELSGNLDDMDQLGVERLDSSSYFTAQTEGDFPDNCGSVDQRDVNGTETSPCLIPVPIPRRAPSESDTSSDYHSLEPPLDGPASPPPLPPPSPPIRHDVTFSLEPVDPLPYYPTPSPTPPVPPTHGQTPSRSPTRPLPVAPSSTFSRTPSPTRPPALPPSSKKAAPVAPSSKKQAPSAPPSKQRVQSPQPAAPLSKQQAPAAPSSRQQAPSPPLTPASRSNSISGQGSSDPLSSMASISRSASVASKPIGPIIPSSPLPKQPTIVRQQKANKGFDDCPTEFSQPTARPSENYTAVYPYRARSTAELSLSRLQVVKVVDTAHQDWWFVKVGLRQGYVPANHLKHKP